MKLWFNEHTSGFRFNSIFITGDKKKKKKIKMEQNPTIILVKALAASAATQCSL